MVFHCECCNYSTNVKQTFIRHQNTVKHQEKLTKYNEIKADAQNTVRIGDVVRMVEMSANKLRHEFDEKLKQKDDTINDLKMRITELENSVINGAKNVNIYQNIDNSKGKTTTTNNTVNVYLSSSDTLNDLTIEEKKDLLIHPNTIETDLLEATCFNPLKPNNHCVIHGNKKLRTLYVRDETGQYNQQYYKDFVDELRAQITTFCDNDEEEMELSPLQKERLQRIIQQNNKHPDDLTADDKREIKRRDKRLEALIINKTDAMNLRELLLTR